MRVIDRRFSEKDDCDKCQQSVTHLIEVEVIAGIEVVFTTCLYCGHLRENEDSN